MSKVLRTLAHVSIAFLLLGAAPATGTKPSDPGAWDATVAAHLDRISRATGVVVYAVRDLLVDCSRHPEWAAKTIECHEIVRRVEAPSVAWRDSLIRILTAPGALRRGADSLTICSDDAVLYFTSATETTRVWVDFGCAAISLMARGHPSVRAAENGMIRDLAEEVRPLLVNLGEGPDDYPGWNEPPPVDEEPQLVTSPELPIELLSDPGAPADTVSYLARIGKDGRVKALRLTRSVSGMDSLVGTHLRSRRYRAARLSKAPVPTWIRVAMPVPRRRRNPEPRDVPTVGKCECGSSTPVRGEFVGYDEAPVPVVKPAPFYPKEARERRVQGSVTLHVLVDRVGTPCRISVIRGVDLLDDAAVEAASRWRFKPARAGGKPVCVWVEIPIQFSL